MAYKIDRQSKSKSPETASYIWFAIGTRTHLASLIWDTYGSEQKSQPHDQKRKKLSVGPVKLITLLLHLQFIFTSTRFHGSDSHNHLVVCLNLFLWVKDHETDGCCKLPVLPITLIQELLWFIAVKSTFQHSTSNTDWINEYCGTFRKLREYIVPLGTCACVYKHACCFILDSRDCRWLVEAGLIERYQALQNIAIMSCILRDFANIRLFFKKRPFKKKDNIHNAVICSASL